jgi:hypothetical protein
MILPKSTTINASGEDKQANWVLAAMLRSLLIRFPAERTLLECRLARERFLCRLRNEDLWRWQCCCCGFEVTTVNSGQSQAQIHPYLTSQCQQIAGEIGLQLRGSKTTQGLGWNRVGS